MDLLDRQLQLEEEVQKLKENKSYTPRGKWVSDQFYMPGDMVYYEGKSYLCVTRTNSLPTDLKDYVLFADRGAKGEKGDQGPRGYTGKDGEDSKPEDVASELKKDNQFITKVKGPKGDKGDKGDTGPKGDKGDRGPKGDKGDKGDDGLSAYEIWKKNGGKGSEKDFIAKMTKSKVDYVPYGGGSSLPSGGTTNQVLKKASDADGDVVWGSGGGGSTDPAGNDKEIQFNDGGVFGSDSHFTYDKTNDVLHTHKIAGDATDGLIIESESGTDIGVLGAANTANVTWYGSHNYDGATANTIAAFGASKTLGSLALATYPSLTELSYVKGVTSAIQTQLDAKLAKSSNLSDVSNAATAFSNIKQDASDSATGVVELATTSETTTGTDATRAVTPDGLSSSIYGQKIVAIQVIDGATTLTTGDGKAYFRIPTALNGMNLVMCGMNVLAKSTSGTPTVQLARGRQANATSAFTFADMLSTRLTIDANEYDSKDATTAAVIDTANDDVATGDLIRIDVDTAGTGATGLNVTLTFQTP